MVIVMQFSALAHHIQDIGLFRSQDNLRREIVEYLSQTPNSLDGTSWNFFLLYDETVTHETTWQRILRMGTN